MMTSQILQFMDFIKTQKSEYLQNEIFFLQIEKNHYLHIKDYVMAKNTFVAEVTFNWTII